MACQLTAAIWIVWCLLATNSVVAQTTDNPGDRSPAGDTSLSCDVDVIVAIDYTTHFKDGPEGNRSELILEALRQMVGISNISEVTVQYGIFVYGGTDSELTVYLPLNASSPTSADDVLTAIDMLADNPPQWDESNTVLALEEIIRQTQNSRTGNRNVGFLITASQIQSLNEVTQVAFDARNNHNIEFVALGLGNQVKNIDLDAITFSEIRTFMIDNILTDPCGFDAIQPEAVYLVCPSGQQLDCEYLDIGFALDASASIKEEWASVVSFTKSFVENFRIGNQFLNFGVLHYSLEAKVLFNVTRYSRKCDVLRAIDNITEVAGSGDTDTSSGLKLLREEMFIHSKRNAPKVGILITDGQSKVNTDRTIPEARAARADGIELLAVGVGDEVNDDELLNITGDSSRVFRIQDFANLTRIIDPLTSNVCPNCTTPGDWVILLDSSGSLGSTNFEREKLFAERLIDSLTFEDGFANGSANIGLMRFSYFGDIQWHLGTYTNKSEIEQALIRVRYTGGSTNTADALRRAREEMFVKANGDRLDQPNILILLTDGGSNNFAETLEEARLTRLANITILVVAISNWVNWREIYEVASDPDERNVFRIPSVNDTFVFEEALTNLRRAACNDETVDNACDLFPCRNGGTCVDEINTYYCKCPPGYAGEICDISCPASSDVVLTVDSSGSIHPDDFYSVQHCLKMLARGLNVEQQHRVGMVSFNTESLQRFTLDKFKTSKQVVDSLSYPRLGGSIDAANALSTVYGELLDTDNSGSQKVAVYTSDGHSPDRKAVFEAAAKTHEANVTVVTVGVDVKGLYSDIELDGITSDPDDLGMNRWLHNTSCSYVNEIIQAMCNDDDDCDPNPCVYGECLDRINGYECMCNDGWSGENCTIPCEGRLDVGILLDVSGSIRRERFRTDVIPFLTNLVDRALEVREDRVQVGLMIYDWDDNFAIDRSEVLFGIGQYKRNEDVKQAIKNAPYYGGMTNTADGLIMAREILFQGDRPDVPNILVIVTDGISNVRAGDTIPEAVRIREMGVRVVVVSIENDPSNLELMGLASRPRADNMVNVEQYSEMTSMLSKLTSMLCNETDKCPGDDPCNGEGVCTNMLHGYWCECNPDRSGPDCEFVCFPKGDIAFVLDASGSVEEFNLEQQLVYAVAERLNFQNSGMRAGVVIYQSTAKLEIPLDAYTMQMAFLNAIGFTRESGIIGTNTASALQLLREEFYTKENGDRDGEPNTVILMTDGKSNINRDQTVVEADLTRQHTIDGVRIVTVGIGADLNEEELNKIADDPDTENTFYVRDEDDVIPVAIDLATLLCNI